MTVIYDANGWKRWCGNCRAPLNHEPTNHDLRLLGFVMVLLATALLVAVYFIANVGVDTTGTRVVPSPHGNPPVVHSIP